MTDFKPIRILYVLRRLARGPARMVDLARRADLKPATQSALRRLLAAGHVERIRQVRREGFGWEFSYRITERGRKRLEYLNGKWGK